MQKSGSINAIGKKIQQQNDNGEEDAIKDRIRELRGKIKMNEKRQASVKEKHEDIITKNEKAILEMRAENSHLRGTVRKALEIDELLVSQVLTGRKRQQLALSGKSSEAAMRELDQTVCDLARKFNDLAYAKKKREEKLSELQKQILLTSPDVEPEFSSTVRQLENSINKVRMKTSSAFRVQGLYTKIRRSVEDEVRGYPKSLDKLEKEILTQKAELSTLRNMQQTSIQERDEAMQNKFELEGAVREDRHQREVNIRSVRNRVKEIVGQLELPHTRGRHTHENVEEQRLADMAQRAQDRLEKIKKYQEKANMLELVTGIPFSNKETLINCFKNQKNSSTVLRQQTIYGRKLIEKNRKILKQCESRYDQMLHEHERSMEEKIERIQRMSEDATVRKQRCNDENAKASKLVKQIRCWLEPLTIRMLKSCEAFELKGVDAPIWKANEYIRPRAGQELDLGKLFVIFSELFCILDSKSRLKPIISATCWEDAAAKNEEDVLVSSNNNRILPTLERKVSEDFDYNTPNNDEYLSRTSIKRHAESRQRGIRQGYTHN